MEHVQKTTENRNIEEYQQIQRNMQSQMVNTSMEISNKYREDRELRNRNYKRTRKIYESIDTCRKT